MSSKDHYTSFLFAQLKIFLSFLLFMQQPV